MGSREISNLEQQGTQKAVLCESSITTDVSSTKKDRRIENFSKDTFHFSTPLTWIAFTARFTFNATVKADWTIVKSVSFVSPLLLLLFEI